MKLIIILLCLVTGFVAGHMLPEVKDYLNKKQGYRVQEEELEIIPDCIQIIDTIKIYPRELYRVDTLNNRCVFWVTCPEGDI